MPAIVGARDKDRKTAATTETDWRRVTITDLAEMHQLLVENTPGPVDPKNPAYKDWLDQGYAKARQMAMSATSKADYIRALKFYGNGFRDGHIQVGPSGSTAFIWPGFLTLLDDDGMIRVVTKAAAAPVPVGARLIDCDGVPADRLLAERVDRFRTNADIPHSRRGQSFRLFYTIAGDKKLIKRCRFVTADRTTSIRLNWSPIEDTRLNTYLDDLPIGVTPTMGVRQVGDIWFVSIPTFNADAAVMQELVDAVVAKRDVLLAAPIVVIDVRGNGGGNSSWGERVAITLWGQTPVDTITRSFDWSTDWRASRLNIDLTRANAQKSRAAGVMEDATYREKMADAMERALAAGEPFAHADEKPTVLHLPNIASPFAGRVYFLTDSRCASACLDFADVVRRLPGVTHIGLPTSADAVYIDIVEKDFKSGAGGLSWPVKVYRNRIRGNNQWYEPQLRWPGGPMTDTAIGAWIGGGFPK